jgi:hypothetical protein
VVSCATLRVPIGLALIVGAVPTSTGGTPPEAERCAERIALFDEIIQSRFDDRILKLDDEEFDEARQLRVRAHAYCTQGKFDFGLAAIDAALERVGALPLVEE